MKNTSLHKAICGLALFLLVVGNFAIPLRVAANLGSESFTGTISTDSSGGEALQSESFSGSSAVPWYEQIAFEFTSDEDAVCGDGTKEGSEECDQGELNGLSGSTCSETCTLNAYCGDNSVNQASEECDDGNVTNGDGCSSTCQEEGGGDDASECGDGTVDTGEQCDDGNNADNDGCDSDCKTESCGDGILQTSEQCDDGNIIDTDACNNSCQSNEVGVWTETPYICDGEASADIQYSTTGATKVEKACIFVAQSSATVDFAGYCADAGHWKSVSDGSISAALPSGATLGDDLSIYIRLSDATSSYTYETKLANEISRCIAPTGVAWIMDDPICASASEIYLGLSSDEAIQMQAGLDGLSAANTWMSYENEYALPVSGLQVGDSHDIYVAFQTIDEIVTLVTPPLGFSAIDCSSPLLPEITASVTKPVCSSDPIARATLSATNANAYCVSLDNESECTWQSYVAGTVFTKMIIVPDDDQDHEVIIKFKNDNGTSKTGRMVRVEECSITCGDGQIDSGEQCDDGNVTNGDGCSATCQNEGGDDDDDDVVGDDDDTGDDDVVGDDDIVGDDDDTGGEGNLKSSYVFDPDADDDQDGLSNQTEFGIGTDYHNPDTDADGLNDGQEVKERKTNPLKNDTDGDQVGDGIEVIFGTDPLDPKSYPEDIDRDGVVDKWERQYFQNLDFDAYGTRDYDKDGLSDLIEYYRGTNPLKIDTDGDNYSDGAEVLDYGTDPLDPDSFPRDGVVDITNWSDGDRTISGYLPLKGYAPKNSNVHIFALSGSQVIKLAQTKSDANGKFVVVSEEFLEDGSYLIYPIASNENDEMIAEGRKISITVDSTLTNVVTVTPEELEGYFFDQGFFQNPDWAKDLYIEIHNNNPTIYGRASYNSEVQVIWHSLVTSSSLIADTEVGSFSERSAESLENGIHEVILYAEKDGVKSDTIRIPFIVTPNILGGYGWSLLWLWILLIVLIVLGYVGYRYRAYRLHQQSLERARHYRKDKDKKAGKETDKKDDSNNKFTI